MNLSDLQEKDIVNINDGKRVGKIIDARIDSDGKILYFIIDERRNIRNFLNSSSDVSLSFDKIKKIGSDVILVDL